MLMLSSCDFRSENAKDVMIDNLPKAIDDCRVLFIPNEKATHESIVSGKYHRRLEEFGFHADNVAVFDHTCPDAFRNLDIDLIYISGGNTFATLQKLRATGFDKDIVHFVQNGVAYIGGSAGAHIASKDIAHVAAFDDVPDGVTDFNGLGLFDGALICHYTSDREAYFKQLQADSACPVYALTDDDVMVVNTAITHHTMNLVPSAFRKMADGSKTIELRLYDPKRKAIAVGDHILFRNTETDEQREVVVQALHTFPSFEELYKALPLECCGYTKEEVLYAHPDDMYAYYTDEQIKRYGVLGIEVHRV